MAFEYDVALSFAGEQRPQVAEVADCLKHAGIKVFYDEYEKGALWGKDLYVYLSDVYGKRAQYCILFASREYAEKVWTNHERQHAQARALLEKGGDYILPVRFDTTEIPGLPHTIGYLDFWIEGSAGICAAFLNKIGRRGPTPVSRRVSVSDSPFALFIAGTRSSFLRVVSCRWGDMVQMKLECEAAEDGSFLNQAKTHGKIALAYGTDAALGRIEHLTFITEKGRREAELGMTMENSNFGSDMEVGTTGTSAEQFAEMRGRRLLLNEQPAADGGNINDVMYEVLIRGQGTAVEIKQSPFPGLFRKFGQDPLTFLRVAWIVAVMQLRLGNVVEHIEKLVLSLDETNLRVDFRGRRHHKYTNVEPHLVEIVGNCSLE